MPSYRLILNIGALRAGVRPETLLPAAREAVAAHALVEHAEVGIRRGAAELTVRFLADDPRAAHAVAEAALPAVAALAEVPTWRITHRLGSRWPVVLRSERHGG
ncbi:hypothetical protein [Leucobacter sp. M11]|uniref:hypothetical protein n=1 Tax=Leucobacter sp. M11 TaxID=2993565 RepID=UPI002D7E1A7C|nr:hypothetical protein [Leucobacter sp. M11]MEB4615537.1 hypothetical protein [Leucobacter sp. M11]